MSLEDVIGIKKRKRTDKVKNIGKILVIISIVLAVGFLIYETAFIPSGDIKADCEKRCGEDNYKAEHTDFIFDYKCICIEPKKIFGIV